MKHAYLLIVHHEFEVLPYLLQALDDPRNDIFIHVDKKVRVLPEVSSRHAGLFVLEERLDVRWGDVSQIAVEMLLFKTALASDTTYTYYHLLSGVDMPLQTQDRIHAFFEQHNGMEFIGFTQGDIAKQLERKVQRYHLFPRRFRREEGAIGLLTHLLRASFLRLQELLGVLRHKSKSFKKGTNWVSVTQNFVQALVAQENQILEDYRYTFCADEIFLHTFCWHSAFRDQVYHMTDEGEGSQRAIRWKDNRIYDWENDDFDVLMNTGLIFARKFNSENIGLVQHLVEFMTKRNAQ